MTPENKGRLVNKVKDNFWLGAGIGIVGGCAIATLLDIESERREQQVIKRRLLLRTKHKELKSL